MGATRRSTVALLAAGAALTYLAFSAGGTAVGLLTAVTVTFGAALTAVTGEGAADTVVLRRAGEAAHLAIPGLLVLFLSFNSGGYFPDTTAFATLVLLAILALRAVLASEPFAGFGRPLAVATCGLALLTAWALASSAWSDAPARSLLDANRDLLYLLTLVVCGSMPRTAARLAWMLRGIAVAMVAVSVAALLSRVLPDVFHTAPNIVANRLSHPLTYWNSLGLFCSVTAVLCLWLTTSISEHPVVRALAAAALPPVCTAAFFTFSRGGIAAGFVGICAFVILAVPRGLPSALLSAVPLSIVAVKVAYDSDLLASARPTADAAAQQGHHVALVVALCSAGALAARLLLTRLDDRVAVLELPAGSRRSRITVVGSLTAVLLLIPVVALDVPGRVHDQYEKFVHTAKVDDSGDFRDRLTDPGNNGRVDFWRVSLRTFGDSPIHGSGADTFGLTWLRERPLPLRYTNPRDAHSLYLETMSELGIAGFVFLLAALAAIGFALLPLPPRGDRRLYASLSAAGLAWAFHAGIDWDWELPAATIWLFGVGAFALAREAPGRSPSSNLRVGVGLAAVFAAIGPALLLVSQQRYDDAASAFRRGDCDKAMTSARSSITVLSDRPDPYEVIALCEAKRGLYPQAAESIQLAIDRDPHNWAYRADRALILGAGGRDPRGSLAIALDQNPKDYYLLKVAAGMRDPSQWRSVTTPLVLDATLSENGR
jgi:O-antigen ligase